MEPSTARDFLVAAGLLAVIAAVLIQGQVVPLVIVAFSFLGFGVAMFMRARPAGRESGIDLG
jgi:hypothetical protein